MRTLHLELPDRLEWTPAQLERLPSEFRYEVHGGTC